MREAYWNIVQILHCKSWDSLTYFVHKLLIVGAGFEVKTDLKLFHTAKLAAIPTLRQFEVLKVNKKV